jgi:uncharacterized protein (TIGR03382 family)
MSWLIVAPILLPLIGAILAALLGRRRRLARGAVVAVCLLMTASAVAPEKPSTGVQIVSPDM